MYMKVSTRLCKGIANQRGDKDDTMIFLPRFTCLPTRYVTVVSTAHLVVRRLIGITRQARTSGTARTYPKSEGSSMTRSTRVALRGSQGPAQCPSQSSSPEHRTSFLWASTETTTKPSRRWQPPRVTSTTGLQLDHLVLLDATSRCNRTRIALSHNRMITIKYMCDGGLPSIHKHGH